MKKVALSFLLFASILTLLGFETPGKWIFETHHGAKGSGKIVSSIAHSGKNSFLLEKSNATGWVSIRSAKPIPVKANVKYALGGYFHTQNSNLQSMLFFRVTRSKDEIPKYDDKVDKSNGVFTQSVLVNALPGKWNRRVIHFQSNKDEKVYLHCVLFGNPASVYLDDITFAPANFKVPKLPFEKRFNFSYTPEQVIKHVSTRSNNSMKVKNSTLMLNGKKVLPVFYKQENRRPEQNRYEEFSAAKVPFAIATIFISQIYEQRGVILPGGKIDYARVDELLLRALRRNPNLNLIVEFVIIEPYPGWGDIYPNEVWQNKRREKAYTSWGNIQGYTKDIKRLVPLKNKDMRYSYMPSYSSKIFRDNISSYLTKIVQHISASPLGKAVAGYHIGGGHDHQFQYPKPDYSPAALKAWRKFCNNPKAKIPEMNRNGEFGTAFTSSPKGNLYWKFRESQVWLVKNTFAGAIKKASNKPVTVSTYLGAPENYMPHPKDMSNVDIIISITPYAFRKSGYPVGGTIPEASYALHNKIFLNELDLRCWNYVTDNEVRDHYISVSRTFPEWKNVHRKLAGMMIANNSAWWYYTMSHYFDDAKIMNDISKTVQIAQRVANMPKNPKFQPGLCIVRSHSNDIDAAAEFNISKDVKMYPLARSVFERSGVPFVTHYLDDVLKYPKLQNYSMYVFLHNTRISSKDKQAISKLLKNKNKILIFVYGTGLLNESGMDLSGMQKLVGMNVEIFPGNTRRTPLLTNHPLVKGAPPMVGMGELRYSIFALAGASKHIARGQQLSIKPDKKVEILAKYAEDLRPAIAMKRFNNYISVYCAAPWGISPELINQLAKLNNTFITSNPGQSIFTNSRFMSLHALKSVKNFNITLPPGTKKVIIPDTGKTLPIKNNQVTLNINCGSTYWLIFEQ